MNKQIGKPTATTATTTRTTSATMKSLAGSLGLLLLGLLLVSQVACSMSLVEQMDQSSGKQTAVTLAVIENPELVSRILESLLRSVVFSASVDMGNMPQQQQSAQKRGLDLGISRGFSGSQAGKHLMGLSAASFANGPGRR